MQEKGKYWLWIGVQVILAVAAIWYLLETRSVRRQNERMVYLLEEQIRLSIAPDLITGIDLWWSPSFKEAYKEGVLNDETLTEKEKQERLDLLGKEVVKFRVLVGNLTPVVAHNVHVFVYDAEYKSFLTGYWGKETIEKDSIEDFPVVKPTMSLGQVKDELRSCYGERCEFLFDYLNVGDSSYVVTIYTDVGGRMYMNKRGFGIDMDGNVVHTKAGEVFFER